jgi:hypothetical protein
LLNSFYFFNAKHDKAKIVWLLFKDAVSLSYKASLLFLAKAAVASSYCGAAAAAASAAGGARSKRRRRASDRGSSQLVLFLALSTKTTCAKVWTER